MPCLHKSHPHSVWPLVASFIDLRTVLLSLAGRRKGGPVPGVVEGPAAVLAVERGGNHPPVCGGGAPRPGGAGGAGRAQPLPADAHRGAGRLHGDVATYGVLAQVVPGEGDQQKIAGQILCSSAEPLPSDRAHMHLLFWSYARPEMCTSMKRRICLRFKPRSGLNVPVSNPLRGLHFADS
jgi:hypothetical protein